MRDLLGRFVFRKEENTVIPHFFQERKINFFWKKLQDDKQFFPAGFNACGEVNMVILDLEKREDKVWSVPRAAVASATNCSPYSGAFEHWFELPMYVGWADKVIVVATKRRPS